MPWSFHLLPDGFDFQVHMLNTFWKLTPGGNPTILLHAADVPAHLRACVAKAIMSPLHIGAEQVGYVRLADTPRLDMMGGEFCLNAARAFALVLAREGMLRRQGIALAGDVEVSGMENHVPVRVHLARKTPFVEACVSFVELPAPEVCKGGLSLLRLPGIVHILLEETPPTEHALAALCAKQRTLCGVEREDAVGSIWLERGGQGLNIFPAVWVRETGTLCRETACGSGTLAVAIAEHARSGETRFSIVQPSGCVFTVRMEQVDATWNVWVGSAVHMTARGYTDLSGIIRIPPCQAGEQMP